MELEKTFIDILVFKDLQGDFNTIIYIDGKRLPGEDTSWAGYFGEYITAQNKNLL